MNVENNTSVDSKNICSNCGSENIETAKFCVDCGQKIETNKETENICYGCGTISPPGIKFCPECGQNLLDQTAPTSNNSSSNLSGLISRKRISNPKKRIIS